MTLVACQRPPVWFTPSAAGGAGIRPRWLPDQVRAAASTARWQRAACRRGLHLTFAVDSDDANVRSLSDALFADLPAVAADPDHRLSVISRVRRRTLAVFADDYLVAARARPSDVASFLGWLVTQGTVHDATDLLLFHAAVLAADDRAVLLPAVSGVGKSTLAAALVLRGLDYLSDEVAAIDPATMRLRAYPKALSLDPASLDLLPTAPSLSAPTGIPSAGPGGELHLPASLLRPASVAPGATPAFVVFPERAEAACSSLERLRPAEAMARLVEHSFNFVHRPEALFERVATLARETESFRLLVADVASACDRIEGLLGRGRASTPEPS